jgi:hypothetical protein
MSASIHTELSSVRATPKTAVDDAATVAALGMLAYICTDLAHEVVGHGIGLLLAGGRSGILTTTRLIYASQLPSPNWRVFDLGGPAINLLWAGVCFVAQRLLRREFPRLRLFLWASMCFSFFWEFGYLMKCGVTGHGDWMALIAGLTPDDGWRTALFLFGLSFYWGAIAVASRDLHYMIRSDRPEWRPRLKRILQAVSLSGMFIACAGAIFDPRGRAEIFNSGFLSSFSALIGLWFIPFSFARRADKPIAAAEPVPRSTPLLVFATIAAIWFIVFLGRGIRVSF